MPHSRVTGPITNVRMEPVISKDGKRYEFNYATVLVAGRSTIDVRFSPERLGGLTFSEGDSVDWLVNVDTYGNRLSIDLASEYPAKLREAEALRFMEAAELTERFDGVPADSLS